VARKCLVSTEKQNNLIYFTLFFYYYFVSNSRIARVCPCITDFSSARIKRAHADVSALRLGDDNKIADQGIVRVVYGNIVQ
jgi:hypothetical protein